MHTTVIFDIGNVLLKLDYDRAFQRLAKHLNPMTAMYIWAKKKEFLADIRKEQDLLEIGKMNLEQFYSRLKGKTGIDIPYETFADIWCDVFTPVPDTFSLLDSLSQTKTVCLASNTNETHAQFILEQYPQLAQIEKRAFSHELRAIKPDLQFYEGMLEQFTVQPNECIFIDDLEENVDGASKAGMTALHYTTHENLINSLREFGIM